LTVRAAMATEPTVDSGARRPRTRFRPCIDLHEGRVKQIVGGTWSEDRRGIVTNFETDLPASHFAGLYRRDGLTGGHVIMLGPGNESAARAALDAWPGGLQIGGGISAGNAAGWIAAGASHVIVTSALFSSDGKFQHEELDRVRRAVGRERLVIDLSCRREGSGWRVAMNRWQRLTDFELNPPSLDSLVDSCAELLIHAADVEGRAAGMDEALIEFLGGWAKLPITYAGGARTMDDLRLCDRLSHGRVDLTIGSALDIFGGTGVRYADCVEWNRATPAD
jgi:phosphoribosylformimino-5-aminoimidazole carboxamide ribotide isomerase